MGGPADAPMAFLRRLHAIRNSTAVGIERTGQAWAVPWPFPAPAGDGQPNVNINHPCDTEELKVKRFFFVFALTTAMGSAWLLQPSQSFLNATICEFRVTPRFTRVGATCARAKQRASDAAFAAARCGFDEIRCGLGRAFVSADCFPHPVSGQTAAEAFVEYQCAPAPPCDGCP